ncbi:cystathionine beta-lyase, chloroplastic-like [Tasmannia lanceolata]|uniref:cystathionine beta-lyase, chloroplastic-like n=1 Tax=Tasmannia lanceolata TaxID=3420 RepID=UPI004063DEFB
MTVGRDPFIAALMECSKDHQRLGPPGDCWKSAKVSRSLSDRFGFIDLYSSCKNTCTVAESMVYLPRSSQPSYNPPSATKNGPYDYTRSGNPTRDTLERLLAKLDKADQSFCFTSGMAALTAVANLVETGQEIVAGNDIFGGSDRLLSQKISEMAHAHGALVMVDNSMMSSVLSQPLELGADFVMQSATKFIARHSDVMAGVVYVKGESLAKEIAFLQNAEGSGLAPFDCWLCMRGIKTMALRVEKQQENAQDIAEFLSFHPRVKRVNYDGLPDHPGHNLHYSQAKGAGSVLRFSTGSLSLSKHIVEATKYFRSVRSLITLPCFMSHASIPTSVRESSGLSGDLIRISVGIEDVEDLIADLDNAISSGPL